MKKFTFNGINYVLESCPDCSVSHAFPEHIYVAANERAGTYDVFCPNGHSWHYKSQKRVDEEAETRRERDRLKQLVAQKDDEIASARREAAAQKGQNTRLRNRAKAGLCPCCNRHFINLERHMASKHSEAEQAA